MPKTVPKNCSQNDDLAECRRPGSGGPRAKAKRRRSELEPNGGEGEDESSHSATTAKRPNRTTESTNQRVNQRRQSGDSTGEHLSSTATPTASPARADFLIQALQRIQELQDEIDFLENDPYAEDTDSSGTDEEFHDPQRAIVVGHQAEALGFAVCVRETMAFLEREGVPADSPMMVNLRNRLVGRCEQNLSC